MGKFLMQLQQEAPAKPKRKMFQCDLHRANTSHTTKDCNGGKAGRKQKEKGGAPYKRPVTGCPPDMADRPRNCWSCVIPGHFQHTCDKRDKIQRPNYPAAVRKQCADDWVLRGRSLQPTGNGGAGVNAIVLTQPAAQPAASEFPPLPPPASPNGIVINIALPTAPQPVPQGPARLWGDSSSVATITAAPVVHEVMDLDRPIEIATPIVRKIVLSFSCILASMTWWTCRVPCM
jgi:hypothetical protein